MSREGSKRHPKRQSKKQVNKFQCKKLSAHQKGVKAAMMRDEKDTPRQTGTHALTSRVLPKAPFW
jgi:hypothetical protein